MPSIDLNADLGENDPERIVADDDAMLALVTSANVSCGAHAGTPEGIADTLRAAVAQGTTIGAHPSYEDREGFGRRPVDVDAATLQGQLERQLGELDALCRAAGGAVRYVKPHGALYNTIARDERHARAVIAAIRAVDPAWTLLGPAGGVVLELAERDGLGIATEAFADRAYAADGTLVPRTATGSVLHDPEVIAARAVRLADEGRVTAIDGAEITVRAQSLCVHGDTQGAVAIATAVRDALETAGVRLAPFVAAA